MVSVLDSSVVDHVFIGGEMVSVTTLEASTLTITPPMIYHTRVEHTNHYTTNDLPHSRRAH
jgi:hypothetical protein